MDDKTSPVYISGKLDKIQDSGYENGSVLFEKGV
jgi:hypothetical protein